MDLFHNVFYQNLSVIYFLYGISLVIMGITLTVQSKKHSELKISCILWLLALFGIIHGISEFLDMWIMAGKENPLLEMLRWVAIILSFSFFFEFGRRLNALTISLSGAAPLVRFFSSSTWITPLLTSGIILFTLFAADTPSTGIILAQYILALPGGILIGRGFKSYYDLEQSRLAPLRMRKYFLIAGFALFLYGILDGIFGPRAAFFPATILNAESFLQTVKIPVEAIRAVCAVVSTWALVGMVKIFDWEISSKLQRAQDLLQQQLRESEARYMEVVESSSDIIHSVDNEFRIISSNTAGCRLLGYEKEELLGEKIEKLCSSATWSALSDEFRRIQREGSAFIDYGQLVTREGSKIDVAIHSIAMFDHNRTCLGMRLTFRDITARKKIEDAFLKSEERYRLLFEETRDAIFISSREGSFVDINQAGLDLFGYEKEDILRANPAQLYMDPPDFEQFQQALEEKEFVRDYSLRLRKKSGKAMDCLVTASLRRSNEGELLGTQGIIRDITERKKMEEEMLKIEKLESIGIMAGGIAHDFNNILTTIAGNISLAKVISNDRNLSEILTEAQKACTHAKSLTSQLLVFSKGGEPVKKVVDMKHLVQDAAGFALRGSSIHFSCSAPDTLWAVEADEGQLMQVIHNLIINAQQAMPDGGTIRLTAENVPESAVPMPLEKRNYIRITVADEGIGIPKEHVKKIFDPFFTTKQNGSGLGLTCTYSIIKKHDGHINVQSEIGSGTSFSLFIPASEKKPEAHEQLQDKGINGSGYILVMDDDENIRTGVRKMLNYLGYDVMLARNGEETVDLYIQARNSLRPFDAVIMDLTIRGGEGGRETIKRLREIHPTVKAIVSSGYFNDPVMADYRSYGFFGVIPKPYEIEDLSRLLQQVLATSS